VTLTVKPDARAVPPEFVKPCPNNHIVQVALPQEAVAAPDLDAWIPVTDAEHSFGVG
jgi:hypothetical protein